MTAGKNRTSIVFPSAVTSLVTALAVSGLFQLLRGPTEQVVPPDSQTRSFYPSDSDAVLSDLRRDIDSLRALVSRLTPNERKPAEQVAGGINELAERVSTLSDQVRNLQDAQGEEALRRKAVTSRLRRVASGHGVLADRLAARAKRFDLSPAQMAAMQHLEDRWLMRDKVILDMYERGVDLLTLQREIERDELAYQREAVAILTPSQIRESGSHFDRR